MAGMVPMIVWVWPDTLITIGVVLVVAIGLRWVLLRTISRATRLAIDRAKARRSEEGRKTAELQNVRHEARAATMGSLLRSITNVVIVVLALLTILAVLGVPMTPLLASAGVGGVALGFGAQSLVKDYLSGIFMIVEDQYGVGDVVDLGDVTGTVEDVGLRVTRVRDANGQIWYIRNGEVLRVGNQSQGWSTAIVDIPVDSNEDSAKVIDVLNRVAKDFHAEDDHRDVLLEQPRVVGVQSVEAGRMTIRMLAKTQPDEALGVQRALLDDALQALRQAGIKGPRALSAPPPSL